MSIVEREPDTIIWYARKMEIPPMAYSVRSPMIKNAGRYLSGQVAQALMQRANELLAKPSVIEKIDVLAAKIPEMEHTHYGVTLFILTGKKNFVCTFQYANRKFFFPVLFWNQ